MIKKPDWLNKNPAYNGKINKVTFLEKMLKEFKEAEKVINEKIEQEKIAEKEQN